MKVMKIRERRCWCVSACARVCVCVCVCAGNGIAWWAQQLCYRLAHRDIAALFPELARGSSPLKASIPADEGRNKRSCTVITPYTFVAYKGTTFLRTF